MLANNTINSDTQKRLFKADGEAKAIAEKWHFGPEDMAQIYEVSITCAGYQKAARLSLCSGSTALLFQ